MVGATERTARIDGREGALRPSASRNAQNRFRFVQWDITTRCNLNCIHCRSGAFYGDGKLERDLAYDAVISRLRELHDAGVRRIHFLGGEPFSRRDLPAIVRHATSLGVLCSVNTNGTLISRRVAEEIVDAGVYLITFSIDGPDAEVNDAIRGAGTFRRVVRGIRHVHDARKRLGKPVRTICSFVLMRRNMERAHEMIDLCSRLGLQNVIFTNLRRMGGASENYAEMALTEAEKFDVAERVAQQMQARTARSPAFACNVQVDVVPLPGKLYLNGRFGVRLDCGRGGCNAITTKAYVQPDGMAFPCQDVAAQFTATQERGVLAADSANVWDATRFAEIPRQLTEMKIYENYVPCSGCPALGDLCVPCPLPGLRGQRMVQAPCIEAHRRAKQHDVDLRRAMDACRSGGQGGRLAQDAEFRARWFGEPDGQYATPEAEQLGQFRRQVTREIQSILNTGLMKSVDESENRRSVNDA